MKALIAALVLSASFNTAFAQEPDYVVKPDSGKQEIRENSSAFHRIGKNVELGVNVLGFDTATLLTTGLYAAYRLNRNSSLLLDFSSGNFDTSFWNSNTTRKINSLGIHFKQFFGNTFYLRSGLEHRTAKYTYDYTGTTPYGARFDAQSTALNFQIGNQWQWQNFTLGCDWFGFSAPLTSSVSNESITSSNASDAEYARKDSQGEQDRMVKKTSYTFTRLYLGWAF